MVGVPPIRCESDEWRRHFKRRTWPDLPMIPEATAAAVGFLGARALVHRAILRGLRAPRVPHALQAADLPVAPGQVREVHIPGPRGRRLFAWLVMPAAVHEGQCRPCRARRAGPPWLGRQRRHDVAGRAATACGRLRGAADRRALPRAQRRRVLHLAAAFCRGHCRRPRLASAAARHRGRPTGACWAIRSVPRQRCCMPRARTTCVP